MIQANDPKLYRAYRLKESLRLLLKATNVTQAEEADHEHWLWWASHSRIPAFHDLYEKIRRHKDHILNTIRLGLSNARIESTTNNKIKLIIRKAYGVICVTSPTASSSAITNHNIARTASAHENDA